ncbi:DUF6783 domain-containing protein [Clostridium transplantifaecale]|uniref:DUF6783 domain-containing protein n=1 Tax=Clostridium transplantifaecale TaxID=2479838 RepID=UPI003C12C084
MPAVSWQSSWCLLSTQFWTEEPGREATFPCNRALRINRIHGGKPDLRTIHRQFKTEKEIWTLAAFHISFSAVKDNLYLTKCDAQLTESNFQTRSRN